MELFNRRSPLSPGPGGSARRATIGVAELTSLMRRGSDSSDEWDGMGVGETSAPDTPVDRRSWAGHPKDEEREKEGEGKPGSDSSSDGERSSEKKEDDAPGELGWEEGETSVEVEQMFEKMGLGQTWKETNSPTKAKPKLTPIRPFSSTSSRNILFGSTSDNPSPPPQELSSLDVSQASHFSLLASGSFGEISFSPEDEGGVPKPYDKSISPSSSGSSLSSMRIVSGSSEEGYIGTSMIGFGSGTEEFTPDSSLETPSPFSLSRPHPKTQSTETSPTQLQVPEFQSPSTPFKISTFPVLSPPSPIHIPRSSVDRLQHLDLETATTSPLRIQPKSTGTQLLPPFQERTPSSNPVDPEPFSPQSDTYSDGIPTDANMRSRFSLSTEGSIQSDEQLLEMEEGRGDMYGEESDDDNPFLYRPPSLPSLQLTPNTSLSRTPVPSPHPAATTTTNPNPNSNFLSHPIQHQHESEIIPPISKFQRQHSPLNLSNPDPPSSSSSLKLTPPLTFKPSHYQPPPAPLFISDKIKSSSSAPLNSPITGGSLGDPFGSEGVTPTQQNCNSAVPKSGKELREYAFPDFSEGIEEKERKRERESVMSPQSASSFTSIFTFPDAQGTDDIPLRKIAYESPSSMSKLRVEEEEEGEGRFNNVNMGPRTPTQKMKERERSRSLEKELKGKGRLAVLRESWEELSTPSPGDGPGKTPFNTPLGIGEYGGEKEREREEEDEGEGEVAELRSINFPRPQARQRPTGRIFDQGNNSTKEVETTTSASFLSSNIFGPIGTSNATQLQPQQHLIQTSTLTKRKSQDKEEAHRLAKKVRDLEEKCRRLERKNQKLLLEGKRGGGVDGSGGASLVVGQSGMEKGLDEVMAEMGINLDTQTIICLSPVITSLSTCPACQKSLFANDDSEWEGETERADRWRTEHWMCLPLVGEILALARTGIPGSP